MGGLNEDYLREKMQRSAHVICAILDLETNQLVYVHLELDAVDLEYDLQGYTSDRYALVKLEVKMG